MKSIRWWVILLSLPSLCTRHGPSGPRPARCLLPSSAISAGWELAFVLWGGRLSATPKMCLLCSGGAAIEPAVFHSSRNLHIALSQRRLIWLEWESCGSNIGRVGQLGKSGLTSKKKKKKKIASPRFISVTLASSAAAALHAKQGASAAEAEGGGKETLWWQKQ